MFWEQITAADREAIAAVGARRRFERGTILFFEGDPSTYAFIVLSGRLKLSISAPDGRELVLELRGAGELQGELGALDGTPRSATITALDRVDAFVIGAEAFRRLLSERGTLALAVLLLVAERLRQSGQRRLEVLATDAMGRLCGRLVQLGEEAGPVEGDAIEIKTPLTQQELAEWIGASRDAVVLALRQLRQQGVVETGRRRIWIHDFDTLRRLASS